LKLSKLTQVLLAIITLWRKFNTWNFNRPRFSKPPESLLQTQIAETIYWSSRNQIYQQSKVI
jgi:hypothetical protein